jgi:hypothetical protein
MTAGEAESFGVPEAERGRYIRLDDAKINLTPPAAKADWFKLTGVALDNGSSLYPHGDEVQTVEQWRPPSAWAGMHSALINQILDEIEAGFANGTRYSDHNAAKTRAAWRVVQKHVSSKTDAQCKEIIKTWVNNGVLFTEEYMDPQRRESSVGLRVNPSKRPS